MDKLISTLSGEDKCISYRIEDYKLYFKWREFEDVLKLETVEDILNNFFIEKDEWYLLGASMTEPVKDGLGEFLLENYKLSPRYASLIAAIMVNEGLIIHKGKKPIKLKKQRSSIVETCDRLM